MCVNTTVSMFIAAGPSVESRRDAPHPTSSTQHEQRLQEAGELPIAYVVTSAPVAADEIVAYVTVTVQDGSSHLGRHARYGKSVKLPC